MAALDRIPDVTLSHRLRQIKTNGGVFRQELIVEPGRVPQLAPCLGSRVSNTETKLTSGPIHGLIGALQESFGTIDGVIAVQMIAVHLDEVRDGTTRRSRGRRR